ncbi:TetR/AcrR family transcriptional regulator [Eupransor demetentiae]|uniref:AcrR family n=1 Tax=Eupransor demetentiae TaxID=3109584 RepID=A0ABP0ER61_9LACO|nr:AcrR family [Lactobacillaceae bacterium LMG 33000]
MANNCSPENIRVKNQIVEGLFSLLKEKPLSNIKISELIERSGVARVSYYRNFDDKEEILRYYLTDLTKTGHQQLIEYFKQHHDIEHPFEQRFVIAFRFFQENQVKLQQLIDSGLSGYFFQFLQDLRISDDAHRNTPVNHYEHAVISGAIYSLQVEWLKSGAKESPEELAKIFTASLSPELRQKVEARHS